MILQIRFRFIGFACRKNTDLEKTPDNLNLSPVLDSWKKMGGLTDIVLVCFVCKKEMQFGLHVS